MWDQETAKLFSAAKSGQLKILRKLKEDAPFRFGAVDPSGNSIAHWAIRGGQLKVLRFLKANFPETLTVLNLSGQEPVHVGCVVGKMMCVAFLVNFASNVNVRDVRGCTPLLLAAENGHVDIAAYLLLHSANILAADNEQNTALHLAAKAGYMNMCSLLITFGASPWDSVNSHGQTPLHLACENDQLYVVRLFCSVSVSDFGSNCVLTELGSPPFLGKPDLEREDNQGRTALSLAYQKGLLEITDYLKMELMLRGKNSDRFAKLSLWATKIRKFIMGEPGRRRFGVLYTILAIICFVYPIFWIQIWRSAHIQTWRSTELIWLILNIPSWICFFQTRYKNPGYLAKDTTDYNSVLRAARYAAPRDCMEPIIINRQWDICETPSFKSTSDDMRRIKHALSSLCHTCRCVRTTRSKHCSKCNRCVAVFDHHCPVTDSCVGKGNRAWFFGLCWLTCVMSTMMAYLQWKQKSSQLPWFWLACFKLILFFIWTSSTCTFLNVLYSATKNLTTNESLNWRRYSYLKGESSVEPSNPFDRGLLMNLSEYFGLHRAQDVSLYAYGGTYGIDV